MDASPRKPGVKSTTPEAAGVPAEMPMPDPAELARNMVTVIGQCQKLLGDYLKHQAESSEPTQLDPFNIGGAFTALLSKMMAHPRKLIEAQLGLWQDYMSLWHSTARRILGESVTPLIAPQPGDKRFKYADWDENEIFDFIKQSYLLTAKWLQSTVADVEGLDPASRKKVEFYTKQFADAIAPTNFLLTNPEVLRATLAENGKNLVRGLSHVLEDLERGKGKLAIRQTDLGAFEVGRDMAVTPGKVVFRNEVIELLQYDPVGETVFKTPLLIFPPWINKFYILDLNREKSFIKWAVEQGLTVFVASWVNPDPTLAQKSFADYMQQGILAALEAVEKSTGERQVNTIGYCIGGTLLGTALAYMAETHDTRVKSATFFAAQMDFTEAGDLTIFVDDAQLDLMKKQMDAAGGVLPSNSMFTTFNMLRANDLVWSYVVNNYLLGRDPFPFDLLFWNSDQTRMPATLHLFYLRNFYKENRLAEGKLEILGKTLDLSKVKTPIYLQSSKEDHIAPAPSVFKSTRLFGGPVKFMVAGSGHIAGVINPPQLKKYQFWTNEKKAETIEQWWEGATETLGSWWPDWIKWLKPLAGEQVPARKPGDGKLPVLGDAPGSYVKMK
jgi:poly[(R)-3-hydroxyalkanoate] polymerase subunit PhaC